LRKAAVVELPRRRCAVVLPLLVAARRGPHKPTHHTHERRFSDPLCSPTPASCASRSRAEFIAGPWLFLPLNGRFPSPGGTTVAVAQAAPSIATSERSNGTDDEGGSAFQQCR
jgi:hypothetical protein